LGEEEEEVPDWLRSLKPDAAGPSVTDTLAPAEVPAWLNQLRPPGTGPLSLDSSGAEPPSPGTASAVDEIEDIEGLVRAEIPEWLSEYRPTGDASAKHRIRGPAEEEGPLEGLAGVLPAAAVVDMPKDFKPVLKQQVTTTIIEQAQLWQHLLELPRSSERVVEKPRQRAGWRETSARLVIFVVLLVVTIAALTGLTASLGFEARIAQSPPVPATISLKDTIDDLQPGDRVIMAVEYGPAESLEMKHISKVLLRHLETQGVDVVIVSTLPEGVGLSYDLAASSTYTGAMEIAYLPGSASGVARFLSITENTSHVDLLLVLSARPERVRWWVEQNAVNASLPVGIGVSSSAGPLVTPYLEATSTQGWLIGFPGVIAYQESQGLTISKNYGYRLNALMLTQWVAIGMLLFGMAYQLVSGKRGVD
ncbi:MAG: hypothetical protein JW981_10660, partial [Anaerolineae bacterium]|nr:hypothetical protein [Anaerolineae bacterium]